MLWIWIHNMKTEIKVLKAIIENKEELTIRDIAKIAGADYKIVHTAVKLLAMKHLVNEKSIGSSKVITLNNQISKELFEAENERREAALKDKNIKILTDYLRENIKTVHYTLLLFGSYAKKTKNKHSDIDLMFIVPDQKHEKEIDEAISLLALPTHHLVFTESQFRSMKDSKEGNVVKEAIKNNIILHGIEGYYELLR